MPGKAPNTKTNPNLHVYIARSIGERILGGEFQPGEILPNEAAWGKAFGASRTAVREALKRAGVEPGAVDEVILGNVLQAGEGQASPTMRFLKNTFRPNDAEKERRNLEKAFNTYLEAWRTQTPS